MKYLFIQLEERNGEQEYTQEVLQEVENDADNNAVADELARTWYSNEDVEDDDDESETGGEWDEAAGEYYHLGGCIAVSVKAIREIPKKHYDILKQYI